MVHDMGVDREAVEIYRELADSESLPIRVYAYIDGPGELLPDPADGDHRTRAHGSPA